MSLTEDIDFTLLGADRSIYTNTLTPVSAVPWPNKFERLIFPNIPISYSQNNIIWDFGDGTKYTGISATHVYNWPGEYKIQLTIINDSGNPVTSTTSYTVSAVDMVQSQMEWVDTGNIFDIKSGQKAKPLQFNFMLSWQNYSLPNRETTTCSSGEQHWMNTGALPGKWMCGSDHPTEIEPPIYTFNLYASGSSAPVLDINEYNNDLYSHLKPFWTFYSTTSSLSSSPANSLNITQLDSVTGTSGDPNTYELIYHALNTATNEFEQVLPGTPGAVFTGLSGTGSYYYYDSIPKSKTSREAPILNFVDIDSIKLQTKDTIHKYNIPEEKRINTKILKRNNIKSRINTPESISITSNGLPNFPINRNKWKNSQIQFVINALDADGFSIIDNTLYTNISVKLIDAETNIPLSITDYTISTIESPGRNYYLGSLNSATTAVSAQLSGSMLYSQASGYTNDAIVGYVNMYRPSSGPITETGNVIRLYHQSETYFDSTDLDQQITETMLQSTIHVNTNGSISETSITAHGSNLTGPPAIIINDPTGTGAELACVYDSNTQTITDIKIINGGINYSSPTLSFISNRGATDPVATATVESNYNCELIAVQLADSQSPAKIWGIETGTTPRLLQLDHKNNLITSDTLTATPVDIKLDHNTNLWLCEPTKLIKYDKVKKEPITEFALGYTANGFDVDKDGSLYVYSNKNIRKYEQTDTLSTIVKTYTTTFNILDILCLYDRYIYALLDNNSLIKLDNELNVLNTATLTTPTGTWTNLTTTTTCKVYISDEQSLFEIDIENMTAAKVLDIANTPLIQSIIGDSRGYVWMIDNGNNLIYYIDVETYNGDFTPTTGKLVYGQSSITQYPIPNDGIATGRVLRAAGDWTGFHWLQKYGYVEQEIKKITGKSDIFSIYDIKGLVDIEKYNENFDAKNTIKTYAIQPWLKENYTLWENVGNSVGNVESEPTSLGKLTYEKIANFTNNNSDLDDCNIEVLHNYSTMFDINMDLYNFNYPPSLKRSMDMLSIKHKRLFGEFDYKTTKFDKFTEYTQQETRENLGSKIDFATYTLTPGEKIVAYEKFSKIFTPITVNYPLSGALDVHNNIIQSGMDTSLVTSDTQAYPLSAYNSFWQWDLIAPVTIAGKDILNYYDFYHFNETVNNKQVEGVIDWDSPGTTLTPTQSSYSMWVEDAGLMDNMIEHQLRSGLGMFNTCITSIEGSIEC